MNTAIVTGANGFIGSALVNELLNNNVYVYAIVHKRSVNIKSHRNLEIIKLDLDNISSLQIEFNRSIDTFYHLAWQGSSGNDRSNPFMQCDNIRWTADALYFANRIGARRFVGAGSLMEKEAIYDIPVKGNQPSLTSVYGSAKLASHYMTKAISASLGIEHIWCYLTSYGVGDSKFRFIYSTIEKLLNNDSIDFTNAEQFYDFVYVTDTAKALFLIGKSGVPFSAYNIGSGNPKQLKEFILEMCLVLNSSSILNFGAFNYKAVCLPADEFSTEDIYRDVGFEPQVSFKEGILKVAEWIKNTL